MFFTILLLAPLLLTNAAQTATPPMNASATQAMTTPAPCPATPAQLPASLSGWASRMSITAGSVEAVFPFLPLGSRADVTLADAGTVRYVVKPSRAAVPDSKGGLLSFEITRAGTYRVALGASAWIDMIGGGKPIASTAHDHGPPCTGVRKTVDFALTPGAYILQISEAKDAVVPVLITPLP